MDGTAFRLTTDDLYYALAQYDIATQYVIVTDAQRESEKLDIPTSELLFRWLFMRMPDKYRIGLRITE